MAILGFSHSADKLVNKFKKLKKEYKDQKKELNRIGSGRSKMINFDVIHCVLVHRPAKQSASQPVH